MSVTNQKDVMQSVREECARGESVQFDDDQENLFAHQLQKFNESLDVLKTEPNPASNNKLRNDSLQPADTSNRVKSEDLLAIEQDDVSLFISTPRALSVNPNAMNVNSAQVGHPSMMYSNGRFWSAPSKFSFSAAQGGNSIAQYGQFTPPDDGPSQPAIFDAQAERKMSLRPSIEEEGAEDASNSQHSPAFVQDESKSKSKSGSEPAKKRRRKSCKADTPEEDQKREEFLARNRVAASKSRQKKKEWTQKQEQQLRALQEENAHLQLTRASLRDELIAMKTLCLSHVECDCEKIREYMSRTVEIGRPGGCLPSLLTSAPSNQLAGIAGNDAAMFAGQFRTESMANFPSVTQSPSSERQPSIFDMRSPPMIDGSRSRMNSSSTVASSIRPLQDTADMKIQESPFMRQDAFGSPEEPALTFGDGLNDPKDMDMSAMWEETVGGGDYITGAAMQ